MKYYIQKEEEYYCTKCDKAIDDLEQAGAPISGTYFVCPFCKRYEADMYDDKKGLTTREVGRKVLVITTEIIAELEQFRTKNLWDIDKQVDELQKKLLAEKE